MKDHLMTAPLSDAFRSAFRHHPAGVAILTANTPDGPVALTVSSLFSISAEPPLVGMSLSRGSRVAAALLAVGSMVIHFPRYEDLDLATLCATPGVDRFGPDIDWESLPTGEPRYRQIGTWFRAEIHQTMPLDGATVVAAELREGICPTCNDRHSHPATSDTLVYLDRSWRGLGPKGPTEPPEEGRS
nr:flavin reductase family protein [uncultured Celeribacter sp.]